MGARSLSQASQRKNLALIDRIPAMETEGSIVVRVPEKRRMEKRRQKERGGFIAETEERWSRQGIKRRLRFVDVTLGIYGMKNYTGPEACVQRIVAF